MKKILILLSLLIMTTINASNVRVGYVMIDVNKWLGIDGIFIQNELVSMDKSKINMREDYLKIEGRIGPILRKSKKIKEVQLNDNNIKIFLDDAIITLVSSHHLNFLDVNYIEKLSDNKLKIIMLGNEL